MTYELEGDRDRETGRFLDEVVLTRPEELSFRLGQLLHPDR